MKTPSPLHGGRKDQSRSQIVPATLSPGIGDVAALDLIRRRHCEFPIQHVRDVRPLHRRLLVGV